MNQDQVKEKLLQLDDTVDEFTVVFTGKKSRKVDGQYHPDKREIIIHNKNFLDDNALMYTAIHEFAHHVHFTRSPVPITTRAHTSQFWNILHQLLFRAEEKGIYINRFHEDEQFIALTARIKEFLATNGHLMKDLGGLLLEAEQLCILRDMSFEDYVDRVLGLHRTAARSIMRVSALDVRPEMGYENMKTVANIREPEKRKRAEEAFLEGKSSDMVKAELQVREEDSLERLLSEKRRIERTLETLASRLVEIERRIEEFKH
jgi:hypothetical protein